MDAPAAAATVDVAVVSHLMKNLLKLTDFHLCLKTPRFFINLYVVVAVFMHQKKACVSTI